MLNNYPSTFTLVQIHTDGGNPYWSARGTFYGVGGTPDAWFDGTLHCSGAYNTVAQQYTWYMQQYNARRAVPTDVVISLTGVEVVERTYTIRANIKVEAGGTAKTMRIYMVQVLDRWPTTPTYSRNCFKLVATTQDVTLLPGQSTVVTRTMTFDANDSWTHKNDIKIIAWAQQPLGSAPAEVYQAKFMNWPFPLDCNANGVPDATDITNGTSQDCNTNGIPDECDIAAQTSEDCNTNGVPDECDLASGTSQDCNTNGVPDECDIAAQTSQDCNTNGVPDECDLASGTSQDCNTNGVPDECDIAAGTSRDANGNGAPDECETVRGDANCDASVNFKDINPFVLMLTEPSTWQQAYPACLLANGDCNVDGSTDFRDINPFITLLSGY